MSWSLSSPCSCRHLRLLCDQTWTLEWAHLLHAFPFADLDSSSLFLDSFSLSRAAFIAPLEPPDFLQAGFSGRGTWNLYNPTSHNFTRENVICCCRVCFWRDSSYGELEEAGPNQILCLLDPYKERVSPNSSQV
ncbi:hypothetical protein MANES_07G102804v8 [Manihot esculenta]|uniref:Uncharacterized protein n=1 Tax=Manihot esculenta TaxID=3983 RepID=A0ACB7HK53_MANES|nr:hypothetical protein MANES_07G102804v8 [Manihot esculenta]